MQVTKVQIILPTLYFQGNSTVVCILPERSTIRSVILKEHPRFNTIYPVGKTTNNCFSGWQYVGGNSVLAITVFELKQRPAGREIDSPVHGTSLKFAKSNAVGFVCKLGDFVFPFQHAFD